jgi:hypothetical protein
MSILTAPTSGHGVVGTYEKDWPDNSRPEIVSNLPVVSDTIQL